MFKLTIETDNADFEDDEGRTISVLLATIAAKLLDGERAGRILDANGNAVGDFTFTANEAAS